jgi:hypothetical protein
MCMAVATIIVNIIVFWNDPHYMVARLIPCIMQMTIGAFAYTGRTKRKADVVYTYLIFTGVGLFLSGIVFLFYYHFNTAAWEYLIVAPGGLVITALGLSVWGGKDISVIWWGIFIVAFVVLISITLHTIATILMNDSMEILDWLGRMGREALQVFNACIMLYVLYWDVKEKPNQHCIEND